MNSNFAAAPLAPGMTQTTTSTTTTSAGPILNQGLATGARHNPLDRNHDGKVDLKDLTGRPGVNQQGLGMNQGLPLNQGLGMNQGIHHNPLDRNHDGRVDMNDLTGRPASGLMMNQGLGMNQGLIAGQTTYVQSAQRASLTRAEPTIMETIQKDVVIHERIHPVQKEEIQPVIYREREQLDVKQVTQMMHETQIQPTIIQQRELPAERREAIVERGAAITENYIAPSREVDATLRTQVVHAPIVNEIIKKTVIEEIQPVLERDIIQSTVIQNRQPIYEKIVEAPIVTRETLVIQQDRGIVGGSLEALAAQGFNIGESGRRLSQTYTTTQISSGLAGQTLAGQSVMNQSTYVNTSGNRRSLVEALPASYNYLQNGLVGQDVKLAEQAALGNNMNTALPSKAVL